MDDIRQVRYTLVTIDGRTGTGLIGLDDFSWKDGQEPEEETQTALFEQLDGSGSVVDSYEISGEQWFAIEDGGELEAILKWVKRGATLESSVDAVIEEVDPDGFDGEAEDLIDDLRFERDGLQAQVLVLRAALADLIDNTQGRSTSTKGCIAARDTAHKVWLATTPETLKAEVLQFARAIMDPKLRIGQPPCVDFMDAMKQYGTSILLMMKTPVFEVIAHGFDGSTDETDDRVIWVLADDLKIVESAIYGTGAKCSCQIEMSPGDAGIDYWLPRDFLEMRARLAQYSPKPVDAIPQA